MRTSNEPKSWKVHAAFRKKVGVAVQRWRTEAGMSRDELVIELDRHGVQVSVATVLRWEQGRTDLRVFHLEHLERIRPGLVAMVFGR